MPSLFEMEITKLKGVGEKRAALYRKLGAPTVGDLLRLYPRAYEDWSEPTPIRDTVLNEINVVHATVVKTPTEHRVKGGMLLYKTVVTDGESDLALTFFNNRYIPSLLREGQDYVFRGKVTGSFFKREMLSPEFLPASSPLPCKTPCSCFLKPCATLSPMPCAANIGCATWVLPWNTSIFQNPKRSLTWPATG